MRNYFDSRDVAERYSAVRPYFHPLVIEKVRNFLGLTEPVPRALDVACGTGLSTVALKVIAEQVVGVDPSKEMMARAPRDDRLRYVRAPAEELPFTEGSFDLVTVSQALHWFDRDRFLAEAAKVLRPSGWLVVYDNRFSGEMKENPEYEKWFRGGYMARYPYPVSNREPLTGAEARRHGFEFEGQEGYTNKASFSLEEMVSHLMSHSNVIAAGEEGGEGEEGIRRWLTDAQSSFFGGRRGTFVFEGSIDYLRRESSPLTESALQDPRRTSPGNPDRLASGAIRPVLRHFMWERP